MPILEDLKEYAERATGLRRPGKQKRQELARARKPHTVRFKDDGLVPNHPRWPLIIYRGAVDLDDGHDPAAVIEDLFEANGWGDTWRDGIYDYVHYHSRIHEVLGIARGKGRVRFGGKKGRIFTLKAGDVAILPAGTGHQCLSADDDFLVIGAYPPTGTYDECTTVEDRPRALKTIPKVPCRARIRSTGPAGRCRNSGRKRNDRVRHPLPRRRRRRIGLRDAGRRSASEELRRPVRSRALGRARHAGHRGVSARGRLRRPANPGDDGGRDRARRLQRRRLPPPCPRAAAGGAGYVAVARRLADCRLRPADRSPEGRHDARSAFRRHRSRKAAGTNT